MADPRWLEVAERYQGLKEIPGPNHNKTILAMLEKLHAWWRDDETALVRSVCRPLHGRG